MKRLVGIAMLVACGPAGGPIDGGPDAPAIAVDAPSYCTVMPTDGQPCAAGGVPDGYVCRAHDCTGGCEPSCSCTTSGTWHCATECRDTRTDGGNVTLHCGTAPLCVAFCSM